MITFITGKPGGGKSYYALRLIEDELVNGTRLITTNIELKLPELRELVLDRHMPELRSRCEKLATAYLEKEQFAGFPQDAYAVLHRYRSRVELLHLLDSQLNVYRRIRILREDEVQTFFLHRGNGVDIPPISPADERAGRCPPIRENRPADEPGIFYVIDEAHQFFNTRAWATNSLSAFAYLAKHRHFNDEIVFISQSPEQVDKQLKLQVQYWIYVLNTGMDLWGRGFRGRENHIKAHWYTEEPPRKMAVFARLQAVKTESIEIEVTKPGQLRLGDCYRTLQFGTPSVGGRATHETRRKKPGRPAWLIAIPVVAVMLVVWFIPRIIEHGVGAALGGLNKGLAKGFSIDPSVPVSNKSVLSTAGWSVRTIGRMKTYAGTSVCVRAVSADGTPLAPAQWFDLPPGVVIQDDTLDFAYNGTFYKLRYHPDFSKQERLDSATNSSIMRKHDSPGVGVATPTATLLPPTPANDADVVAR